VFTQKHGAGKRRAFTVSTFCKRLSLHGNFNSRIRIDTYQKCALYTPNATVYICQGPGRAHTSTIEKISRTRRAQSLYIYFSNDEYVLIHIKYALYIRL